MILNEQSQLIRRLISLIENYNIKLCVYSINYSLIINPKTLVLSSTFNLYFVGFYHQSKIQVVLTIGFQQLALLSFY